MQIVCIDNFNNPFFSTPSVYINIIQSQPLNVALSNKGIIKLEK